MIICKHGIATDSEERCLATHGGPSLSDVLAGLPNWARLAVCLAGAICILAALS